MLAKANLVKGKAHAQKVGDNINGLQRWLKHNPTSDAGDRAAAENVLLDLIDANRGPYI
ncbi:MAG: hypothetical protein AB8B66_06410 [Rickettsiaceae bacterium]